PFFRPFRDPLPRLLLAGAPRVRPLPDRGPCGRHPPPLPERDERRAIRRGRARPGRPGKLRPRRLARPLGPGPPAASVSRPRGEGAPPRRRQRGHPLAAPRPGPSGGHAPARALGPHDLGRVNTAYETTGPARRSKAAPDPDSGPRPREGDEATPPVTSLLL